MSYHLGVDLGTTYTAAAIAREGRAETATLDTRSVAIPSVVYQHGEDILVGTAAARRSVTEPDRVAREFKRRVGDPIPIVLGGTPVAAELLMAKLLRWVVDQVATTEGERPASLAVSHPANWGEYKLDLLSGAIRHVELRVDHWVPEPVAAASYYAAQRRLAPGAHVAVYDLGGGTFDTAVVRVEDRGYRIVGKPDGIERLGGIDFDQLVFQHVMESIGLDPETLDAADPADLAGLAQLRDDCVDAKEALSHETDVSIPVMLPARHSDVRLTRTEFEAMIRRSLDQTVVALRRTIGSAGVAVEALHAVLLVGGSSRIPLVAKLVGDELGRPIALDARPKDAIPLGTSLVAWRFAHAGAPPPPVQTAKTPADGWPSPAAAVGPPLAPTPPATGPTPSSPSPPPGSRSGRRIVLGAAAVLAVLAGILAALLLSGDDDDPVAGNGNQTTTTAEPDDPDEDEDATTTTEDDSDTPPGTMAPLPGDDWNDEARSQFVAGCSANPTMSAVTGDDAEAVCTCIYDGLEDSGASFADFNEVWVAEDIQDETDNPAFDHFNAAIIDCAATAGSS